MPFPELSTCRKIWYVCYNIIRCIMLYLAIPARSIISNVEKLLYLKYDTYPRFLSKFIFCPRTNFWHIFACEYITVYIVPNKRADGTTEKTIDKYKCINILFWNIQGNIHSGLNTKNLKMKFPIITIMLLSLPHFTVLW